jgi:hypothetical protein
MKHSKWNKNNPMLRFFDDLFFIEENSAYDQGQFAKAKNVILVVNGSRSN